MSRFCRKAIILVGSSLGFCVFSGCTSLGRVYSIDRGKMTTIYLDDERKSTRAYSIDGGRDIRIESFPSQRAILGDAVLADMRAKIDLDSVVELRITGSEHTISKNHVLDFISRCHNIRELSLVNLGLTDSDLVAFRGLNFLNSLDLSGNPIVGTGLKQLQPDHLAHLELSNTPLTDVSQVVRFTSLKSLYIVETPTTFVQIAFIENALPSCKVFRGFSEEEILERDKNVRQ